MAAELVAPAPRSIDLTEAAALPLTGLAARQAVIELAGVEAGQSVLVNGAGGAVAAPWCSAAEAGATVTAVDVVQHADRLREHGAERVVGPLDLDAGPAAVDGPFDVVVKHMRLGPEDLTKLTAYVADGGIVVSSAGPVPADGSRSVRSESVWVSPDASALADLVARVDSGRSSFMSSTAAGSRSCRSSMPRRATASCRGRQSSSSPEPGDPAGLGAPAPAPGIITVPA